jgi:hypothetical protein
MPQNHYHSAEERLRQFRQSLVELLPYRADALMNLIDALCSNTSAQSIAELSLNPIFRYQYCSIYDGNEYYDAIGDHLGWEQELTRLVALSLPPETERPFILLGIDATSQSRPFAVTLSDRSMVYSPNPIASNTPVTIGHRYSTLVYFPEKLSGNAPPWVVPLSTRRIPSDDTEAQVCAQQVEMLYDDEILPFKDSLCVQVVDSTLSAVTFLGRMASKENLVTIARLRGNRVLYRLPQKDDERKRGHPRWYGSRLALKDETTRPKPDEVALTHILTRRGKLLKVNIQAWHNLVMRGSRKFRMHLHPFTLLHITITASDGKLIFKRPLWLCVMGNRRDEISLIEAFTAYRQRYDIEHFFRFGKQRLLWDKYQTPDIDHEENWWQIVALAYVQLWLAHPLTTQMPRPWERYLSKYKTSFASPTDVVRDFPRIISTIETNREMPKLRGKSPGRKKGEQPKRREKQKVIKKGKKASQAA